MIEPGGYQLGPGGLELMADKERSVVIVRPVSAGAVARLRVQVDFPAIGDQTMSAETGWGVVLSNRQQALVTIERRPVEEEVTAAIVFSLQGP